MDSMLLLSERVVRKATCRLFGQLICHYQRNLQSDLIRQRFVASGEYDSSVLAFVGPDAPWREISKERYEAMRPLDNTDAHSEITQQRFSHYTFAQVEVQCKLRSPRLQRA
eukprot:3980178-Amphidinium_carterae.1